MSAYKRKQSVVFYCWSPTPLVGAMDPGQARHAALRRGKAQVPDVAKCAQAGQRLSRQSRLHRRERQVRGAGAHADRVPVQVSVPLPVMNETLAHMEESGDESAAVAKWFLKNHRDVWAKVGPRRRRRTRAERALAIPRSRRRPWRRAAALCPSMPFPGAARPDSQPGRTFPLGTSPRGKGHSAESRPATRAGRASLSARQAMRASPPAARPDPPGRSRASAETEPRTCFLKSFPPDRCGRRSTVLSDHLVTNYADTLESLAQPVLHALVWLEQLRNSPWWAVVATVVRLVGQPTHRAEPGHGRAAVRDRRAGHVGRRHAERWR